MGLLRARLTLTLTLTLTLIDTNPNPSQWVFYVTAAVLHLGNLSFTPTAGGEGSALDSHSQQLSALAAHYLQVSTTCSVGLRLGLGLGLG